MSFRRWLQNFRSALAPRRAQLKPRRRSVRLAATYRPRLEVLEDRSLLSFSPITDFPVSTNPQALVAADFNYDGHLDLATVDPGFQSVSVLLGDGAGGFGAAKNSVGATNDAFERPSLTVADFNNDGRLDLATAMYGHYEYASYGRLDVWMGNGDGTFQSPTLIYVPGVISPLAVAAGDFNNDGNSDLLGTFDLDGQSGFLQVLVGNGLGGFTYGGGAYYGRSDELVVGDLNGDGNLDAVIVDIGPIGTAFLGDGAGGIVPAASDRFSTNYFLNVALGDFTGDGILDLVNSGGGLEIFTGFGDGAFDEPIYHSNNGYGPTGVAVADFDGDGRLDVVKSDADTGTVSELLGNGNGTLTYAGAYAVGFSPWAIAVGDFNGDGRPDVATANAGANSVSVLLNDGDWTPPPPPPPRLRIADAPAVTEGNTGTRAATFTVTLSAPSSQTVTVAYASGNVSATAGSDYQPASGTVTFAPGATSKTITVLIAGDRLPEPTETFVVNLSGPTNATIADGQGVGTITDDEPRISIGDVTKVEGKKGTSTLFTFTVSLSKAYDQAVTVSFRTANGTAKSSNNDYVARTGTLTFAPGETTKTIVIEVKGDSKKEDNETFYLDLFGNSGNSLFTKNRGVGKILNDD